MGIKERLLTYVPFFHHYELDEVIDDFNNEMLVRIKKDDYEQSYAYMRIVTVYNQNDDLKELEEEVNQIIQAMESSGEGFVDFETYMIEDEKGYVMGMDLCALIDMNTFDDIDIESVLDDDLYQVGLYYYDLQKYDKAIQCFRLGEEIEDSDCLCILGYMYEKGYGFDIDLEMAARYYKLSSDLGNVVASCNLAFFYEFGYGVEKDYKKAFELYSLGLKEEFPRSLFSIGYCYHNGLGIEQDMETAIEYYLKAADKGYMDAYAALGECFEFGDGVTQNYTEALSYYEKAAMQDNSVALYKMGRFYDLGLGCVGDKEKAFSYYKRAADHDLDIAIVAVATCYEFGNGVKQSSEEALKYFTKAANMDYVHGQYCLGYFYEIHKEIPDNYQKSFYWYNKACEKGDSQAMVALGYFYEVGHYVEKDLRKAFKYYQKAAAKHDLSGYYCSGVCYIEGKGVRKNAEIGLEYLHHISSRYSPASQYLGFYYKNMNDDEKAVEYFIKAVFVDDDPVSAYQIVLYGEEHQDMSDQDMIRYLKIAVDQGYGPAVIKYALYLENGIYVERDYEKAYEYLLHVDTGEGLYHLGRWHFYGIDDKEDKALALKYFQMASKHHIGKASFMVGYMYHYGDGVEKDINKAKEYYQRAINEGSIEAKEQLYKLEGEI